MPLFRFQDFSITPRYFDFSLTRSHLLESCRFAMRQSSTRYLLYFIQVFAGWCFHKLLLAARRSPMRFIHMPYEAVLHIVVFHCAKVIHQIVLYVPRNAHARLSLVLRCLSPTNISIPYVHEAILIADVLRDGLVFFMPYKVDTFISYIPHSESLYDLYQPRKFFIHPQGLDSLISEALIPPLFSRFAFSLVTNLLPSFVQSRKSLQVPRDGKPILLAPLSPLDVLCFATVSLSS